MSTDEKSLSPYAGLAKKIRPEGSAALEAYQNTPPKLVIRRGGSAADNVKLSLQPQDVVKNIAAIANALPGVEYFVVRLNDVAIGRIKENETFRTDIVEGEHWLSIQEKGFLHRAGRFRLKVTNGQTVCFVCHYAAFSLILKKVE